MTKVTDTVADRGNIANDPQYEQIVLGGGCFWCLDAVYRMVKGIISSECGYAGGHDTAPTFKRVSSGITGHAEVVRLTFDPIMLPLRTILSIFWTIHDPTTLDRQGADVGKQYRSVILMTSAHQSGVVDVSLAEASRLWGRKVVTEVGFLDEFFVAESEHQNYFKKHPERGYCQVVINPKLGKLRSHFAELLRY